jgi:hypothetical protein
MRTLQALPGRKRRGGFTINELLVAITIFVMVTLCLVTVEILGLQMNAISASKMKSTQASLKSLNYVRDQVLGAFSIHVGNLSGSTFTATDTTGDAIQIYPGTNTIHYLRFYWSTNTLCEYNSSNSITTTIAQNITNAPVFEMATFQGNVSSSSLEHFTIRMTLQFSELDYKAPKAKYEYYTMQTEMTPRLQSN